MATAWVGGIAGCLQARRLGEAPATMMISSGIADGHHEDYLAHFHAHDPHLARIKSLPVGQALASGEVIDDGQLFKTTYYNEFWQPQGLSDLQGVVLVRNESWVVTLATFGSRSHRFDLQSRQRMSELAGHMTRALALSFAFDATLAEPALHALASVDGVLLFHVDSDLRVVEQRARDLGGELVRAAYPLAVERNVLVARMPDDQTRLGRAVQLAVAGEASGLVFGSGENATSAAFAPGPRTSPFGAARCVSVVLASVRGKARSSERKTFAALPSSLQAVLGCLTRGLSDKEIAVELGLSLATARTYVTRVMKRTLVRNRRDFMRDR